MPNTFSRDERLSGKKNFELLLKSGKSFFHAPFRVIWKENQGEQKFPARIAFAVPKRNFRKAVRRNRVKRLLREAYRCNKMPFYEALTRSGKKLEVILIFSQNETPQLRELEDKLIVTLERLVKKL